MFAHSEMFLISSQGCVAVRLGLLTIFAEMRGEQILGNCILFTTSLIQRFPLSSIVQLTLATERP